MSNARYGVHSLGIVRCLYEARNAHEIYFPLFRECLHRIEHTIMICDALKDVHRNASSGMYKDMIMCVSYMFLYLFSHFRQCIILYRKEIYIGIIIYFVGGCYCLATSFLCK